MSEKLKALCPDAKFGTPEFAACSQTKLAAASAECGLAGPSGAPAVGLKRFDPNNPCAEDAQQFCRGDMPGTPDADACLKKHLKELSPACAAFGRTKAPAHVAKVEAACVADARSLCPGLTMDDGTKYADCMTDNSEKLSPACRKARKAPKKKSVAKDAARTSSPAGNADAEGK